MTFTPEQLKNWEAYEKVRQSAECNMFDRRAGEAAGLTPEQHLFCMEHYAALRAAHEAS